MDKLEQRIFELLSGHRGIDSAITAKEIQAQIGSDERRIRKAISRLVQEYHCPIASSVSYPYGFYFITNEEEAKDCLRQYWSRIAELSKRAKALNKTIRAELGKEIQMELDFNAHRET